MMKSKHVALMCVLLAALAAIPLQADYRHLQDVMAVQTFVITNSAGKFTCGRSGTKWVPGKISKSNFLPYATQIKTLKKQAKAASGKKKTKLLAKIASLSAANKKGKGMCAGGPPVGGGPTPTPTPGPSSSGNFDSAGNVTAAGKALFGIPSSLNGNIGAGRTLWQAQCAGCHGDKLGRTFSQYRGLISQAPMFFSSSEIPDGSLANLTAYLNRFRQ